MLSLPTLVIGVLTCTLTSADTPGGPPAEGLTGFTEEGSQRGIHYTFGFNGLGFGVGVGFADLDMDGDPDIVLVGGELGRIGIFENDGAGNFADRSQGTGLGSYPEAVGIATSDYDADGDIDVYVSVHGAANALLRNDGNFQFTDVALQAVVNHPGNAQGAAWGDYDRDGWLDLYVSNRDQLAGANLLYRNQGNGTFVDVATTLGVDMVEDGMTFHTSFFDYNHDRLPDLYLCTDKGNECLTLARNHLFENQGGTFVEVTDETGTEACVGCMGTAIGDFDADGYTDLYCTNLPTGNVLLLNQGDNTFTHAENIAGVGSFLLGWGTLFFDYDNNGFLDLYVCNQGPNRLYHNGLGFPCPDVAPDLGLDTEIYSHAIALADVEGDGDLDLLVEGFGVPAQLYINHEGDNRNWLQVKLFGATANTQAIGARVSILAGGRPQYREVRAGVGFKSSSSLVLPFGLDDATIVDELRVEWPVGADTVLYDVAVNQKIIINQESPIPPVRPRPLQAR